MNESKEIKETSSPVPAPPLSFGDAGAFLTTMMRRETNITITEKTMSLLLNRILTLESAVSKLGSSSMGGGTKEKPNPETKPYDNLLSLAQNVDHLQRKVAGHDVKIKTLAFNVSGGDQKEEAEADVLPLPNPSSSFTTTTSPPSASSSIPNSPHPSTKVKKSLLMTALENEAPTSAVKNAEKVTAALRRRETESLDKLKIAAHAAAKYRALAELGIKKKHEAGEEELKKMQRMKEENSSANARKQMEARMKKMQQEMAERARASKEEAAKAHKEAQEALNKIEEEARVAKEGATKAEAELKAMKEMAILESLKKKSGGEGTESEAANTALKAAEIRQKTPQKKRDAAMARWRKAVHAVMTPAARMKRGLGSMLDKRVDKTQTVVSRMEKAEIVQKQTSDKLRQLEKLLSKQKKAEGTIASEAAQQKSDVAVIKKQTTRAFTLIDELTMAIIGTSVAVAVSSINSLDPAGSGAKPLATPLDRDEPTHRDSVVKSLRRAATEATAALAVLLEKIALSLSRPTAEDFDALAVSRLIISALQAHGTELKDLSHKGYVENDSPDAPTAAAAAAASKAPALERMNSTSRASAYSLTRKSQISASASPDRLMDDIVDEVDSENRISDRIDENEELLHENHLEEHEIHTGLSMEEVLRLELHRLVACRVAVASSAERGGGAKMYEFFEGEIDRLESAMKKSGKDTEKKLSSMSKIYSELTQHAELLSGNSNLIGEVEAKVADVRGLLSLKAEREQVQNIGDNIGTVTRDLNDIKSALPATKDIIAGMHRLEIGLGTKADKDLVNKLRNTVKNGMKDDSDPAFTKRCLSCDKPLESRDENEELAQTAYVQAYMKNLANMRTPQQKNVDKRREYDNQKYGKVDPYGFGYVKPKSPYKSIAGGSRPKSAGGISYSEERRNRDRQNSIKFGSSQPLHVTLFANDGYQRGKAVVGGVPVGGSPVAPLPFMGGGLRIDFGGGGGESGPEVGGGNSSPREREEEQQQQQQQQRPMSGSKNRYGERSQGGEVKSTTSVGPWQGGNQPPSPPWGIPMPIPKQR